MLKSLMYISESNLDCARAASVVATILDVSIMNNGLCGVTGALVYTGDHFIQVLEGEGSTIDGLLSNLETDLRHRSLKVVKTGPLPARRFISWSMGYVGPSNFVTRHARRLLDDPSEVEATRATNWLATLLVDTARTSQLAPWRPA